MMSCAYDTDQYVVHEHHRLFDRGMLGLDDDLAVVVSQRFSARTPQGRALYDPHGRRLQPRPGTPLRLSGTLPGTASSSSRGRRWPADVDLRPGS